MILLIHLPPQRHIIEGWTCGKNDIDKFIRNTIYNARLYDDIFLEWVSFDKFEDIRQIGEGGFASVYSATWKDGKAKYIKRGDGSWIKLDPEPMKVALKRLYGSQNMSAEYLNEVYFIIYYYYYYYFLINIILII